MANAIVLCSGGLDSVVTAWHVWKKLNYDKVVILFFDYGQRTLVGERKSAKKCALEIGAEFKEIKLEELGKMSGSLINKEGDAGEIGREDLRDTFEEGGKFYVPCRNLIFLSYALAFAESEFVKSGLKSDIFVGFKCEGKESFPDTTKEFVSKVNELSLVSCGGKFSVVAPFHDRDKEDIVLLGKELGANLGRTWSCYVSNGEKQCGKCLACALRREGFRWANVEDETEYQED